MNTLNETALKALPPHDADAEVYVLGACLFGPDPLAQALDLLSPDDFYRGAHRTIFRAMLELFQRDEPVDVITLADKLTKLKSLEDVGGLNYLDFLESAVPTSAALGQHARIVKRKKLLREVLKLCHDFGQKAYDCTEDEEDLLQQFERAVSTLAQTREWRPMKSIQTALKETFDIIETAFENPQTVTGLPTGFIELDRLTSGLQKTDLVILAARPSMGKTSLALDVARYASLRGEGATAFFSLEMGCGQLALRLLCSQSYVSSQKVRTGYLKTDDYQKLVQGAQMLSRGKLEIDDTAIITPLEIRAKAKRLAAEHPLALIVIDYLQLMTLGRRIDSREREVAEISRSLKGLAKELDVPVLALAQLNRSCETRVDKRPLLSDLRESGSMEQDADLIMFIYRDEVYNKATPDAGVAEIIIAKHRNGPIGSARLAFEKQFTRFLNLQEEK